MKTKINQGNEQESNMQLPQNSRIRAVPRASAEYTIFIDDFIGPPSEYRDETHLLLNATQNDDITIIINSGGGNVASALQIAEAIQHSNANITGVITHSCGSAATLIALSCENISVLDSAEFFIHQGSFSTGGQSPQVKAYVDFTHTQLEAMIDKFYTGFLTKKEIEQVKTLKEFYFTAEETRERLINRGKYLKSLYDKANKQVKVKENPDEVAVV